MPHHDATRPAKNAPNPHPCLFFALQPDETIRNAAAEAQNAIKAVVDATLFRWVRPTDFHITLCFLGETDPALQPAIVAAAGFAAATNPSFHIQPSTAGIFPYRGGARVIWLGIDAVVAEEPYMTASGHHQTLSAHFLSAAIRENLDVARISYQKEAGHKALTPHITLAYARKPVPRTHVDPLFDPAFAEPIRHTHQALRPAFIRQFFLMQTIPQSERLDSQESRYNIVHSFLLRN